MYNDSQKFWNIFNRKKYDYTDKIWDQFKSYKVFIAKLFSLVLKDSTCVVNKKLRFNAWWMKRGLFSEKWNIIYYLRDKCM